MASTLHARADNLGASVPATSPSHSGAAFGNLILPGPVRRILAGYGARIGQGLLDTADLDADGTREVIFTASAAGFGETRTFFIVESDLETVQCVLEKENPSIRAHYFAQLDDDPPLEVLIAAQEELLIIDGASCAIEHSRNFSAPITAAAFGHTDGDGELDLVFSDGEHLFKSDPFLDFVRRIRQNVDARVIEIGPFVQDSYDDIAVVASANNPGAFNDREVHLFSGTGHRLIRSYFDLSPRSLLFGRFKPGADRQLLISRDSNPPVLAQSNAIDLETLAFPWPLSRLLKASDVDGDGFDEIATSGRTSSTLIFNIEGELLFSAGDIDTSSENILVTDIDDDGRKEVIFAEGAGTTASDHLLSLDLSTEAIEFRSIDRSGSYQAQTLDAGRELFVFSAEGRDPGGIAVIDRDRGSELFRYQDEDIFDSLGATAVSVGHFNQQAVFCAALDHVGNFGTVKCFSTDSYDLVLDLEPGTEALYAIELSDRWGGPEGQMVSIDFLGDVALHSLSTGELFWRTRLPGHDFSPDWWAFRNYVFIGNEIWILDPFNNLTKIDLANGQINDFVEGSSLRALAQVDQRIFAATDDGAVGILDLTNLTLSSTIFLADDPIFLIEPSEDGRFLFTAGGQRELAAITLLSVDQSRPAHALGKASLMDLDFKDESQATLATVYGLLTFDIRTLDRIFESNFNSGQQP